MTRREPVVIVGAGLCGSLLAVLLARRGYDVTVLERRDDPRLAATVAGRSINLAMSARGMRALEQAELFAAVEPLLLPMRGRLIHGEDGETQLQPYGQRDREVIWSVSRAALNRLLIEEAARSPRVSIRFRHEAVGWDGHRSAVRVRDDTGREYELERQPVIAADGAGSAIRRSLEEAGSVDASESLLPHGYKELAMPAAPGGGFRMTADVLHIWPRGEFMLIALPNPGGDFTLTLFLPMNGKDGFNDLVDAGRVERFFRRYFADAVPLIPGLVDDFLGNPVGILGTVRSRPWHDKGRLLLIGDAAHAIVPFHGQGMNLAFEDCRLLDDLLADHEMPEAFAHFESIQRDNASAIADMALENYVEMRDTVRDPAFQLRKRLSFELEKRLPDRFIPRYSMVMFHDEIPYAVARDRGDTQERLLDELTRDCRSLEEVDMAHAEARVRDSLPALGSVSGRSDARVS